MSLPLVKPFLFGTDGLCSLEFSFKRSACLHTSSPHQGAVHSAMVVFSSLQTYDVYGLISSHYQHFVDVGQYETAKRVASLASHVHERENDLSAYDCDPLLVVVGGGPWILGSTDFGGPPSGF
jgi:hypothetical protein